MVNQAIRTAQLRMQILSQESSCCKMPQIHLVCAIGCSNCFAKFEEAQGQNYKQMGESVEIEYALSVHTASIWNLNLDTLP